MIISTVRSSLGGILYTNTPDDIILDEATCTARLNEMGTSLVEGARGGEGFGPSLGFLVNEKRLNVAVTRAKSLLIVIGDARLLEQNGHWRELIKFARRNGE